MSTSPRVRTDPSHRPPAVWQARLTRRQPIRHVAVRTRPCERRYRGCGWPRRCTGPAGRPRFTPHARAPANRPPHSRRCRVPASARQHVRTSAPPCGQLDSWPGWEELQRGVSSACCGSIPKSAMATITCKLTCTSLSAPSVPKTSQGLPCYISIDAFIVCRARQPGRRAFACPSSRSQ